MALLITTFYAASVSRSPCKMCTSRFVLQLLLLSCFSRVQLFATPWTAAHQAPPSMGFSRQEYWSGLPFPSPRDLSHPGIKPRSPTLQADALPWATREAWYLYILGSFSLGLGDWLKKRRVRFLSEIVSPTFFSRSQWHGVSHLRL